MSLPLRTEELLLVVITDLFSSTIHLHKTSEDIFDMEDPLSKYTGILLVVTPFFLGQMPTIPTEKSIAKNDVTVDRSQDKGCKYNSLLIICIS